MFENKKAKKDLNTAIKIFTEMFVELNEKNLYGVTIFTPVTYWVLKDTVNDEINNHIKKMAEECGVFAYITEEIKNPNNTPFFKYTLSMEPIIERKDNIINLDEYRRLRKKTDENC